MNTKSNYDQLEREYVAGAMSLRELGRMHGITNHSLIVAQSTKREWVRKRAEYQEAAAERAVVYMADQEGMRRAQEMRVRDNAIEAIDQAITKMRSDMALTHKVMEGDKWVERPLVIIRPADIAMLIDRLQVLFNKPSSITEERNLGIRITGSADPNVLRGIVEATRGIAVGSGASSSPIPRVDRASPN